MSTPSRDPGDDEDLAALVSELETTLADLRDELTGRERGAGRDADRRGDRGGGRVERSTADRDRRVLDDTRERRDRRRPPRPPSPGELFRFTSDYTIPTVVAVLEATIEALELLQGVIDLAAPGETPARRNRGRGARGGRRDRRDSRGLARTMLSDAVGEGVTAATDRAAADAADALERLRETLSEADLPEDEESRDLVADARDLSAELERRVRESRETVDRERDRERRADRGGDGGAAGDGGPVSIEVGEPDGSGESNEPGEDGDETEDGSDDGPDDVNRSEEADAPEVDVDAELESIKREVGNGNDDDREGDEGNHGDDTDGRGDAADDIDGDADDPTA
ncbi:DUF7547 family protein [Halobaculum roseum]|uniref:Uncharacterized protein n=1 Tax=Halobaculum roseum TaxID=2175149 RepID=A0ABD5MIA9_9EURY|nr:hypothetical protein [Halobaculum roseum]QZY02902.1 hypothetical protein K6T36_01510 [Halobaculum roseum]